MKARTYARTFPFSIERICYAFLAVVVLFIALYAYFVIGTIVQIVLREELEIGIKEKHSALSHLEAEYFSKEESITLDLAYQKGFRPVTEGEFAPRHTALSRVTSEVR